MNIMEGFAKNKASNTNGKEMEEILEGKNKYELVKESGNFENKVEQIKSNFQNLRTDVSKAIEKIKKEKEELEKAFDSTFQNSKTDVSKDIEEVKKEKEELEAAFYSTPLGQKLKTRDEAGEIFAKEEMDNKGIDEEKSKMYNEIKLTTATKNINDLLNTKEGAEFSEKRIKLQRKLVELDEILRATNMNNLLNTKEGVEFSEKRTKLEGELAELDKILSTIDKVNL